MTGSTSTGWRPTGGGSGRGGGAPQDRRGRRRALMWRSLRAFPSAARSPGGARLLLAAGLLATLALLLAHAAVYWFLTDDAFISFRYARNLRHGDGLVFNPGLDRVEGYTNFLWVVLLAGGGALGVPPETAANLLSLAATLGLWGLVIRFTLRFPPPAERRWLILVPPLFLAATRSVAGWSRGGLETRLFELLALGGLLRLVVEVQAQGEHGRLERAVAPILLALATPTRPRGLGIAAAGFGAGGVLLDAPH